MLLLLLFLLVPLLLPPPTCPPPPRKTFNWRYLAIPQLEALLEGLRGYDATLSVSGSDARIIGLFLSYHHYVYVYVYLDPDCQHADQADRRPSQEDSRRFIAPFVHTYLQAHATQSRLPAIPSTVCVCSFRSASPTTTTTIPHCTPGVFFIFHQPLDISSPLTLEFDHQADP